MKAAPAADHTGARRRGPKFVGTAPLLAVGSMLCFQIGSALSVPLLLTIGPCATTWLRLLGAATLLCAVSRPTIKNYSRHALVAAALLGASTCGAAILYSEAIARIPLGTATAIEFIGPLALAVAASRRLLDLGWASLAGMGVFLLTFSRSGWSGDVLGIGFAAGAALCLAAYIVLTKRVGQAFAGFQGLTISITAAAIIGAPIGISQLSATATPLLIAASLALGLLIPVPPYGLEMLALRRMSTYAFGILISADPAISALVGFLALHQQLDARKYLGIACVIAASIGTTAIGGSSKRPP